MNPSKSTQSRDRKILFWMGVAFVVFAAIIGRLMTGSWFGLLFGVGAIVLWLAPLAPGLADMVEQKQKKDLLTQIQQRDEEISRLHQELAKAPDRTRT